jgi:hypothetical protein
LSAEPAHGAAGASNPTAVGPERAGTAASGNPAAQAALRAAERVIKSDTLLIELPDGLGAVRLPAPKQLAFYGGIAALAVFGIIDWPVAVVLGVGHLLAEDHHHKALVEFGEALAEA